MPGIPFTKDDPRINREGRPPGTKNFTTKVREALEKIADGSETTYEQQFIASILKKAIVDQDAQTMKLIWNYLDGMPAQSIELGGNKESPVKVIYEPADKLTVSYSQTVSPEPVEHPSE